ncbi:UDP-glucose 4-epimerase GalE [Solibacillus sp. CAU 1738]|uniref:UDP-glucose 4-epimerase GalE n=1 Tax=Solibacillus sp. CAU 1738 TaxID=3140363 RepID=UPI00325FF1B6
MNILITGGNGFIGSHTIISLREHYPHARLVIADNLTNSTLETFTNLKKLVKEGIEFYNINICNEEEVATLFINYSFNAVIHFAGLKAVGESVEKPLKYYRNNLISTLNLVKYCLIYDVGKFVFSSSATVYGNGESPFIESHSLLPTSNPYGETKAICERILIDVANTNPEFCVSILRYFNPIGAHESGLIGEAPNGIPNNLMPYITKVAKGELETLHVFGNGYPTIDGTGVRDYIHIMDLADGHVAALVNLKPGVNIYNLGTGNGTSVLQLIDTFEKVNGVKIPYKIVNPRSGDLATIYADARKAERELNWNAKRSIEDMCRDAWNFAKNTVTI